MKKTILFFCFSILLISCNNEEIESDYDLINNSKIENVSNMKGESQKIAYKMLNSNEKLLIWQKKLDLLLNLNLNDSQVNYVKELQSTLKIDYFKNESINDKEYLKYLSNMKKIGFSLFNSQEMATYFSNINLEISKLPNGKTTPPDIYCGCSTGDDWCVTGDCYSLYCSGADAGCGWWLQQTCNGFCATN